MSVILSNFFNIFPKALWCLRTYLQQNHLKRYLSLFVYKEYIIGSKWKHCLSSILPNIEIRHLSNTSKLQRFKSTHWLSSPKWNYHNHLIQYNWISYKSFWIYRKILSFLLNIHENNKSAFIKIDHIAYFTIIF